MKNTDSYVNVEIKVKIENFGEDPEKIVSAFENLLSPYVVSGSIKVTLPNGQTAENIKLW
jgi:RNA binding exosome subunit